MSVAYVPDGGKHPRLAYGVGRKVGTAVVRNRVRRRLRSAAHELARTGGVPPGAYLVTVRPSAVDLPYARLRQDLGEALVAAASRPRRPPPGRPAPPPGSGAGGPA